MSHGVSYNYKTDERKELVPEDIKLVYEILNDCVKDWNKSNPDLQL